MAWIGPTTAASGGAIAASSAAQKRRRNAEEEHMTGYTEDELNEGWEFKIVRSDTPVFRKPQVLARLREEEARAGWTMVEKFDNSRVRFKRPRAARAQDPYLPEQVDPYRTQYGKTNLMYVSIMVGLILLVALAVVLFVVLSIG
jgi:hypothetical protein